jgi:hypothetical protein
MHPNATCSREWVGSGRELQDKRTEVHFSCVQMGNREWGFTYVEGDGGDEMIHELVGTRPGALMYTTRIGFIEWIAYGLNAR